jgi:hypothetical protein
MRAPYTLVRMVAPLEQELQQAIEQWLTARETFHGGNGIGTLDEFWEAHRRLLVAFTSGWPGDDTKILYDAYHNFLRELVHTHERPSVCWRRSNLLT